MKYSILQWHSRRSSNTGPPNSTRYLCSPRVIILHNDVDAEEGYQQQWVEHCIEGLYSVQYCQF